MAGVESNSEEVQKKLATQLDFYKRGLKLEMFKAVSILEAAIKQNVRKRSGLHVRTGALLNSIQSEVKDNGTDIEAFIGSYGVEYAAVHEFGHTFPPRKVLPRNGKALAWPGPGGMTRFSKGHMIPQFRVPARPYIRPALDEKRAYILERFGLMIQTEFELE